MASRYYYFDTSALIKLYFPEAGSDMVVDLVADPSSVAVISELAILEVNSALAKKAKRGEITKEVWELLCGLFDRELMIALSMRRLRLLPLHHSILTDGIDLIRQGIRDYDRSITSLDSLHLASARTLSPLNAPFVSADKELCDVATFLGLEVIVIGE
ncbi:MAG TPA: type II toxin-antitoxin system VapC family toxin [Clostridia bacterium]|nr:type II toxin-antitoxin system VapC family toxin [Clostridia bacterium]